MQADSGLNPVEQNEPLQKITLLLTCADESVLELRQLTIEDCEQLTPVGREHSCTRLVGIGIPLFGAKTGGTTRRFALIESQILPGGGIRDLHALDAVTQ